MDSAGTMYVQTLSLDTPPDLVPVVGLPKCRRGWGEWESSSTKKDSAGKRTGGGTRDRFGMRERICHGAKVEVASGEFLRRTRDEENGRLREQGNTRRGTP